MDTSSLFRGVVPFVTVAEELSYRKAAERLGVSAAAVSKAVSLLEEELGVVLLQRTSRAVSLTTEGEAFLSRCQEAILALKGARQEASVARNAPQGKLVVSASPIVAPWVTHALQALSLRYPRLSFRLSITDRLARFAEEDVDVAVRVGELSDSSLGAKKLRQTRWVLVASPAYLGRCGAPTDEAELRAHHCLQFLSPNGRPRPWALLDEAIEIEGALLVDHGPTLLEAALSGFGVAQLLDFMVREHLAQGRLMPLLPSSSSEGPAIFALYSKGRQRNANVKVLLEALTQAFL
jgi:LysR family transcriptional regulator, regulator for bpeEF and oprC